MEESKAVVLVEQTVKMPKEAKEIKDLLVSLVKDLRAKKSIAEISAHNLPALMTAVDGFEQLSVEAKAPQIAMVGGVLAGEVGEALMTPVAG